MHLVRFRHLTTFSLYLYLTGNFLLSKQGYKICIQNLKHRLFWHLFASQRPTDAT